MVRTRKKSDSGETTDTDPSTTIDIPTDDVKTTTATNDVGTTCETITENDINESIPWSMTREGKTGAKGTRTSGAIKREDTFA